MAFQPAPVQPTKSWPKEMAFQLTPNSRATWFATMGAKATKLLAAAKDDTDVIAAAGEGIGYMIDNFYELDKTDGFSRMDVSHHPLQKGILVEQVMYKIAENGNGTKDVLYMSLHIVDMVYTAMMDVYWDERVKLDTAARAYNAKVHHEDGNKRIYHSLIPDSHNELTGQKDNVCYGDKIPWLNSRGKAGEIAYQMTIDCPATQAHPWITRDNYNCALKGSAMFQHHARDHEGNIFCVSHLTVPSDTDLYDGVILPMSIATSQQIAYGNVNSKEAYHEPAKRQRSNAAEESSAHCAHCGYV